MADQQFRIDVVIDPAQSAAGARVVERQLTGLEKDAAELRTALNGALSATDQGVGTALDGIDQNAREAGASVRGLTEEQRRLVENIRRQEAVEKQRLALTRAVASERIAAERAAAQAATEAQRRIREEAAKSDRAISGLRRQVLGLFAGLSTAFAVREFVQLSDVVTNTRNRLRLVTDSEQELIDTQRELFRISNDTRSSFEGTATIFSRLAVSADELGVSNRQLLEFTESLNQAIILSGASAQEASAGLIQLSQGLASGTLRGDELRSVLEQLPAVADVIARGLGVTRGELRKLGEDGKITATAVLDAFKAARGELNDKFATTVPTVGQAFSVLRTKVTEAVSTFNDLTGTSEGLAKVIVFVGNNIQALSFGVGALAAGFAAVKVSEFVIGLKAVELQSLKSAGAIGVLTAGALAIGSIYQSIADDQRGASEAIRNTAEDSKVINGFAKQITDLQRRINDLRREAEKNPTGPLAEEIDVLTRRLEYFREEQKRTATEQIAAQKAAAEAAAQVAAQRKAEEENVGRQSELLAKIRKPMEDYVQLQQDLGVLLAANKITQAEFNAELARAKPPEPPKAPEPKKAEELNPFAEQTKSLREQNAELAIRANNLGLQQEGLLIELELQKQGVTLTAEQRTALASLLLERKELSDKVKEQAENQDKLNRLAREEAQRLDNLKEQLDVNAQVAQQMRDLLVLREREKGLTQEVDDAIVALRIRQLESAKTLEAGFERAFLKIKQEAEDLAKVGESVVDVFANRATDALVEFAETGKINFKEFASAILADITRIIARLLVVQALNAVLNSGSSGATGIADTAINAGRAGGGTVQPGQRPFPVGEDGPELFVPNRTGTIMPNPKSVQQAPPVVNVQVVNVRDPDEVPREINGGAYDQPILNVLARNPGFVRQLTQG